ncbi:hypothetical protein C1H46_016304 [Malus baccata]|uniref:Uncharacterized protein n=1 Tax=Malus baccata TaxID=106549 RepID=A0A540MHX3_MALBA|nr:hypothetical protein C1H46_016304 [Malus baccata]
MVLSNVTIYEIDVGPSHFELGDDGIEVIDSGVTCNLNMNWHYSDSTWIAPVVVSDEGTCGSIWALVETIEERLMKHKEQAASILLLICQRCRERYRGLILREGAMPGLLQLSPIHVDGYNHGKGVAVSMRLF